MITLSKRKNKDFTILNLSDFQLSADDWNAPIALTTVDTLVKRSDPDLITISGDLAWCCDLASLENMATLLEKYGLPWAVVFGNHDQDGGIDKLDKSIELLQGFEHFTYENGPRELGRGNYIINISDGEKIIHSLFMMDTHDRFPYVNKNGEENMAWAKLIPEQIEWYKEKVKEVKALGSPESTLITHIPIYAYRYAWDAAFNKDYDPKSVSVADSYDPKYWNEGYKDSYGVEYESISCYPEDEFMFDAIKELDHTKNVLCGHDHVNNYSINYQGVRLTFTLKTTNGCYFNKDLNGGTVLTISDNGKCSVYHEYVDISEFLK